MELKTFNDFQQRIIDGNTINFPNCNNHSMEATALKSACIFWLLSNKLIQFWTGKNRFIHQLIAGFIASLESSTYLGKILDIWKSSAPHKINYKQLAIFTSKAGCSSG
ncbi:CLUMA_CG008177, isoform A [Clunio marinus]|uniref:CLUMA_CG008177, isoform A n=1 Tax=Clunio marinus TaxID=568069 RepID=A0A1J1I320_9DIPT|nr:CLUMA_CG008177, isoform A [Clunio marinus]